RDVGMVFQHLRELGFVKSRKPDGFFEGMFRRHDHQKEEVTRADDLKTETDQDMTGDPSLQGASWHVASPVSRWRCGEKRVLYRSAEAVSSRPCKSCEVGGYGSQPPWDPKTLRRWMSQRRAIRAWLRNRAVGSAHPRHSLVLEGVTPWKPLFFCLFSNLLRFSGNI